jgi:ribosomal protein S18 acetylase RimI-like enzyme
VSTRIRQLHKREVATAASLLARAFADDPFLGYFLADPPRRRRALPSFFAAVLYELIDSHAVYVCEQQDGMVGVAAWLPPEPKAPSREARLRARLASARVRLLFPRAARQVRSGFEALAADHPNEPHWYLAFIGIEPGEQGQGLGRQLLDPVLERADGENRVCYLETPFPGTRAFYRKLRFTDTAEVRPFAGAPPIWTMTRQPEKTSGLG